jgi:hypothetical protein
MPRLAGGAIGAIFTNLVGPSGWHSIPELRVQFSNQLRQNVLVAASVY